MEMLHKPFFTFRQTRKTAAVEKKTGQGKNRCRANKGHKSKRTRRDTQRIRITDKLTGIKHSNRRYMESQPLCILLHPAARCHRVYEISTTMEILERRFQLVIRSELVTVNCTVTGLPSGDTLMNEDDKKMKEKNKERKTRKE
jgi:hypothetical protein